LQYHRAAETARETFDEAGAEFDEPTGRVGHPGLGAHLEVYPSLRVRRRLASERTRDDRDGVIAGVGRRCGV
jgi:hypothetical protein